ncbi:MAG: carboxymuconolactone decarboxylase family protein [Acidimicrobiia bacterium]|nr:carboxymuconolactone decarboxylase family protein [Acidimicrobiia bacterium]
MRERIMLSVSQVNGCKYCCYVHTHWAQLEGASDEELARLDGLDPDSFDRDEWLAMSYAVSLAEGDFTHMGSELADEIERRSGSQRRDDVETIARVMTFANLMANTLDAFIGRLKGAPDPDGRVLDEVLISSVLLLTGPFSVIVLAAILRMSPIRFVREILQLQGSVSGQTS